MFMLRAMNFDSLMPPLSWYGCYDNKEFVPFYGLQAYKSENNSSTCMLYNYHSCNIEVMNEQYKERYVGKLFEKVLLLVVVIPNG